MLRYAYSTYIANASLERSRIVTTAASINEASKYPSLIFSYYSVITAFAVSDGRTRIGCITRTSLKATDFTIAVNTARYPIDTEKVNGIEIHPALDTFAATTAARHLGLTTCSATAESNQPLILTASANSSQSVPIASRLVSTIIASPIASPTQTEPPSPVHHHSISLRGKIALGITLPIAVLVSAAIFVLWIRRKRLQEYERAQSPRIPTPEHTKPELDAKQSRFEIDGNREMPEMAADQTKYELGTGRQGNDEIEHAGQRIAQELRGAETSHEIDA